MNRIYIVSQYPDTTKAFMHCSYIEQGLSLWRSTSSQVIETIEDTRYYLSNTKTTFTLELIYD